MIKIRKAFPADAAAIAPLMLSAMEEIIFYFMGERDRQKAIALLTYLISQPENQYSYEHIIVAEEDEKIIGQICIYPGDALEQLRAPVRAYLRKHFNRAPAFGEETYAEETYIVTLVVVQSVLGRCIGKILLLYVVDLSVCRYSEVLSLLVE